MISTPVKLIADIAAHTLGAGGKRLRPALTVLSAQICGDDATNPSPRVVKSAGAVELPVVQLERRLAVVGELELDHLRTLLAAGVLALEA